MNKEKINPCIKNKNENKNNTINSRIKKILT